MTASRPEAEHLTQWATSVDFESVGTIQDVESLPWAAGYAILRDLDVNLVRADGVNRRVLPKYDLMMKTSNR